MFDCRPKAPPLIHRPEMARVRRYLVVIEA
jgi:hypothetical protein